MVHLSSWCHASNPGKIRVVFDCNAEYGGVSVNKRMMPGPVLANQIINILVRFRENFLAGIADLEAMFCQVFVADQYRSLLSYLWWENGNINEKLQDYNHSQNI